MGLPWLVQHKNLGSTTYVAQTGQFPLIPALASSLKMSSSVTSNGVVVVTHVYPAGNGFGAASPPHSLGQAVYPAGNGIGAASPPHCLGQAVSSALANFRKGDPKALGVRIAVFNHLKSIFGGFGKFKCIV